MRLLLLTPIPSPFVVQPLKLLETKVTGLIIQSIFYADISHRPTWGKISHKGYWLTGNKFNRIRDLKKYVTDFSPEIIVLGQYNRLESWWLKRYARRNSIPTHLLFVEPLIPSNFIFHSLKLYLCSIFFKDLKSIGCMGRRALSEYSSIFNGDIYSCPYCFDLRKLFNFTRKDNNKREIVFLYSGRLSAFRDPILALRCFAEVIKISSTNVRLIISGKGELERAILSEIENLDCSNYVTWMNDFEDWEDIRNLYRYADVLISLGKYNTWSLTIQEAMAAGLGVVATHTTEAANELIINNFNGYLVDHDNLNGIVDAMYKYVENPKLIEEHGNRNRNIAQIMDINVITSRIEKFLFN